jgi:hypothetical protein
VNRVTPSSAADSSADDRRRERRELIRAHHPDRGGDPDVFIALLQGLAEDSVSARVPVEIRFVKRRRRWKVLGPRRPFRRHQPNRVI